MKTQLRFVVWILMVLSCIGWTACGSDSRSLVYAGESDPADFSLSNTKPEQFNFEIAAGKTGPFDFALELTYFDNQMQGWEALPLYFTVVHPDGKEVDKRFSLNLKDEKGGWRGTLKENLTDRVFEETIQTGLALSPGKYTIKLFGDSKDLSKPILGIVHVAFKVYSH